jgi:hypothetical protein
MAKMEILEVVPLLKNAKTSNYNAQELFCVFTTKLAAPTQILQI